MRLSSISFLVGIFAVVHVISAVNASKIVVKEAGSKVIRPTISEVLSTRSADDNQSSVILNLEAKQTETSEIKNDQHSSSTQNRLQYQPLDQHAINTRQDRGPSRDHYLWQPQENRPTHFFTSATPIQNGTVNDLSYNQHLKQSTSRTLDNHQFHGSNDQFINQQQLYNRNQETPEGHQLLNTRQQPPIQVQHYNDRQNILNFPSQKQTYNTMEQSHEQKKQLYRQLSPDQQKQIYGNRNSESDQENLYNIRHKFSEQEKQQHYNSRPQPSDQKILNYNARQQFSEPQQQLYNIRHQSMEHQEQIYNPKRQFNEPEMYYNSRQQSHGNQKQQHNTMQQLQGQQRMVYPTSQQLYDLQNNQYNKRQPYDEHKEFYNSMEQVQDQQQFNIAMQQIQTQQMQPHNARQQTKEQLKFYSEQPVEIENQDIHINNNFNRASIDSRPVQTDSPKVLSQDEPVQIRSKDLQNARKEIQVSAIENKELGLPLRSSANSASNGLANLQSDFVNNGGHIPSTHATNYGRDATHKRTASLSQHLKTPYARYEYSHTL